MSPLCISIVGWSGSGKTTFCERLVEQLGAAGVHVGVIKHHGHGTQIDVPGKDSWRYSQAGANPVILSSEVGYATFRMTKDPPVFTDLVTKLAPECDLILAEGFRDEGAFVFELSRAEHNTNPLLEDEQVKALISDSTEAYERSRRLGIPLFGLDDFNGVASFVMQLLYGRKSIQ